MNENTLENLNQAEKSKIIEYLKQLKQLKKHCTRLEKEYNEKKLEKINLISQADNSAIKLEEKQNNLIETVGKSRVIQNEIEKLALNIQNAETEKKIEENRFKQAKRDINEIKEIIETISKLHEKEYIDVSIATKIIMCDRSTNTYSSSVSLNEVEVQVNENEKSFPLLVTQTSIKDIQSISLISDNDSNNVYNSEDEELLNVITLLNAFS